MWLASIFGIWTLWGIVWLALGLWANRTDVAVPARRQAVYRTINILAFALMFADGIYRRTPQGLRWTPFLPRLWHVPPSLGWLLALLALGGMILAIWSRLTLGKLWSAAVTRKEGHRIIDSGPYALVRHPIYTALLMGSAAIGLGKGTPTALAGFALMILGYSIKARLEERFLAEELGAGAYAAYRRRVPMLVPFAPPARG
ncbi:isoprenylcysteine carboxylmethyltransferase family protein [Sphingomonas sp. BIUV-7]|uniref:Isoprenylcysteine carboxylmethyltransferase family protein n=1 Tax=Sphingomonas natans TaxID=3063330 RepID=A0ABT8Y523_9SPHN|nr:isoprenylcysteine carboxylmethyltransferase family protein [Sphingomonas sp. BIUV-7]MDO6413426.1 isoprenylcysteine carboxylmethyltransferase family protein [Sphingomonas sp. BIUV-7]